MKIWSVPVIITVAADSAEAAQSAVLACEIGSPVTGDYDFEMTVSAVDDITEEGAEQE